MKISAGKLDRRLTLLQPVTSEDAFGGPVTSYLDAGQRWCSRLRFTPSESERDAQRETVAGIQLLVRLGTVERMMDTTWRVLFDGEQLEIIGLDATPADGSLVITGRQSTSAAG